jgi:iron complex transport system substrate-binding protein
MMRVLVAGLLLLYSTVSTAGPSVVDSAGRTVTLQQPATRIVGLAPHIVENIFSAGAGEKLVGVVSYSDYPEQAKSIPQVGSAYAWSLESLVALSPDLVVLWGSGNGMASLAQLERLGIPVYVSEPRKLADIGESIRDIGELAGTSIIARQQAAQFEATISALDAQYGTAEPPGVFYQIWNNPLQTVNGEHMISHVIQLCGGRNVFGAETQLAPRIGLESVLQADPQVIVASGMDVSRPEWLDDWKQYPSLRAVQNNALLHVHPDLIQRPTTRIALGARDLCEKLERTYRSPQGTASAR